jgi:hypothetical protein
LAVLQGQVSLGDALEYARDRQEENIVSMGAVRDINEDTATAVEESSGALEAQAVSAQDAEQAARDLEAALRDQLQQQQRLTEIAGQASEQLAYYGGRIDMARMPMENLQATGEGFLSLLEATGNELLLAGEGYDQIALKYGLATESQLAMRDGLDQVAASLGAGNITLEQASALYDALVTGQLASADAALREAEAMTARQEMIDKYGETLTAQAEAAAASYGIDPYAQQADSAALLAENAASAADPVGAVAEQSERINEAVSGVLTNAAPAFTALAESAPNALPPIMVLADRMSSMRNNLGVLGGLAESAFEAMNEAASSVVAEGAPLARANTQIAQMRAAWAYLLANPTLSLNVYLQSVGSLTPSVGMAGGGVFMTSGPTHLTVGDNPGGQELVTVTPISGTGTTRVNGQAVHMAGGGSLLAGGMGSTTTNYITVYAQSFDDFTREMKRRGLAFAEVA